MVLPPGQVDAVRAAVERYRAAQRRLEEQANAGLGGLVGAWGGRSQKAQPPRTASPPRARPSMGSSPGSGRRAPQP